MGFYTQQGKYYGRFSYNKVRYPGYALAEFTPDKTEPKNKRDAQAAFETFCGECRTGKIEERKKLRDQPLHAGMTVDEFITWYKADYVVGKKLTHDSCIDIIGKYFAGKPLALWNDAITFRTFKTWLMDQPIMITKVTKAGIVQVPSARKRSPNTWNHYYARLRHMARRAKSFKFISEFPFADDKDTEVIGREEIGEGRKRGVTMAERQAIYAVCTNADMKDRWDVTIGLGCRRGEMLNAQLEDVNFEQKTLTFPGFKIIDGESRRNTKTGKTRTVPIDHLMDLFERKRKAARSTEWPYKVNDKYFLFGKEGVRIATFNTTWNKMLADAGLANVDLRWHDLRGERGTELLRAGVSDTIVAEFLGNTPAVLRKSYQGDLLNAMRQAVAK